MGFLQHTLLGHGLEDKHPVVASAGDVISARA